MIDSFMGTSGAPAFQVTTGAWFYRPLEWGPNVMSRLMLIDTRTAAGDERRAELSS